MYFYKGIWNYRAELAGDFSLWTENKNRGDNATNMLTSKRFFFFAEPQFWYQLKGGLSIGTKINTFYHVNTTEDMIQIYPTAAIRIKL